MTASVTPNIAQLTLLVEQCGRERQPEEGLQKLQLADSRNAALGEPAIPEHEADQHAE